MLSMDVHEITHYKEKNSNVTRETGGHSFNQPIKTSEQGWGWGWVA